MGEEGDFLQQCSHQYVAFVSLSKHTHILAKDSKPCHGHIKKKVAKEKDHLLGRRVSVGKAGTIESDMMGEKVIKIYWVNVGHYQILKALK